MCLHIIPILGSLVLVALNLEHFYFGVTFPGTIIDVAVPKALMQVLAEMKELLIVPSPGTAVWHVVRSALVDGDRLPLGLIGSGFEFSDPSYFWSPDFWCFIWFELPQCKRFGIAIFLVVCVVISMTAGPASAMLLIPRQHDWTVGSADFYLRGTDDDMFPNVMKKDSVYTDSPCISRATPVFNLVSQVDSMCYPRQ
jgi:hypothetical protein